MTCSKSNLFNGAFSHIYIEKGILNHPNTERILARLPSSQRIIAGHYKDVFCRNRQNYALQKKSPSLILANERSNHLYKGAPVCQDFGNRHFYYASSVMNCIYDCEYCYLQGMYPSANIVVFVNLEDIFHEVDELLAMHPVYLCISYDTDLLALEQILGYVEKWFTYAAGRPGLELELRTKSCNWPALARLEPLSNVVLAWTLSPESIRKNYEHLTPSFEQRLDCIQKALDKGFRVRLCFDPIIYQKDWDASFAEMVKITFSQIPAKRINDVSIGVFRVSQDYLKRMRTQRPSSAIVQYPYVNCRGVFHYGEELSESMISYAFRVVSEYIPEEKIFVWK